ncbi:hypothetical protein J6590_028804 [Homalodisca vitripennis]|nr:hypothetical protein J6590_028804 [Homalodisca vitripennis]
MRKMTEVSRIEASVCRCGRGNWPLAAVGRELTLLLNGPLPTRRDVIIRSTFKSRRAAAHARSATQFRNNRSKDFIRTRSYVWRCGKATLQCRIYRS